MEQPNPQPAESPTTGAATSTILDLVANHTAQTGHTPINVVLHKTHSVSDFTRLFRGTTPEDAEAHARQVENDVFLLQAHGLTVTVCTIFASQFERWLKENGRGVTSASAIGAFAVEHARQFPEDTTLYGGMTMPLFATSAEINDRGSRWAVSLRPSSTLLMAAMVPRNIQANPGAPLTATVIPWAPKPWTVDTKDQGVRDSLLDMYRATVEEAILETYDATILDPSVYTKTLANKDRQPVIEDAASMTVFPPAEHVVVKSRFVGFAAVIRTVAPYAIGVLRMDAPVPQVVNVRWINVDAEHTYDFKAAVAAMNTFVAHSYAEQPAA